MDQLTVPKTPGARRAGRGEYLFELAQIDRFKVGADYSTTAASCIEGDRMMFALARMAADTGADTHSNPNKQWIFVLEGTLVGDVAGVPFEAKSGVLVYIPANTVHSANATSAADVVFLTVKDNSHSLHGIKAASPIEF
jgi:quercetin dioxygenase-like cupin family protein